MPGIWSLVGPINVGGRVTDVVAETANSAHVYVAAASGGVFKTTNSGAAWTQVFDGAGSLSIGALALHPTDFNTLYVATGEANPGGGSIAYGGDGVWKTTDGGTTWVPLGLANTVSIARIAVDPQNPARVFVAATGNLYAPDNNRGIYRSTDSGGTWQQVLFVNTQTGGVDLAIDPSNPQNVYCATWERYRRPDTRKYGGQGSGVYKSTNGGTSWTLLTSGLPAASTEPGRIGIAVSAAAPSNVYAIYADTTGYFVGFYRSTNGGATFTKQPDGNLSGFYSSYGWWFGRLYADQTVADRLWALGFDIYRTTDGGGNWTFAGGAMHVDHHAFWAGGGVYWEGNDGGLYRSTTGTGSWVHEDDIPMTQFYTNDLHASQPLQPFGGAQDNGILHSYGGVPDDWVDVYGGDGLWVVVDPANANIVYAESQYGDLGKSVNGGNTFSSVLNGISGRTNWSTPVVMDPSGGGNVLYYGANRLFKTTNGASSWSAVSPDLTDGNPGSNGVVYGTITAIAPAPTNPNTIYAGTDDANVWVSTNGGGNWTKVDAALPEHWVTRVAVDPGSDAIAYATLSGYRDSDNAAHVYRTTNYGGTWTDISGNLPNAPVNDLVIDPAAPATMYVATDVGVFASTNTGASWAVLGSGLPEVVAMDLASSPGPPPISTSRPTAAASIASTSPRPARSRGRPRRQGLGQPNPNRVRVYTPAGAATTVDFLAYAAGAWGVNVASGDVNGGTSAEILTGPGPGPIFGPHVRGWARDGTAIAISYFAYGTLKFGANVGSGNLDGDAYDEILSGPGPGAIFGPHVRGWNFDNAAVTALPSCSYFAYLTLRYGVNVADGDVENDSFQEILTAPGPGTMFGPQVRGWDYDGTSIVAISKINFNAFSTTQYGASVAGGQLDADAYDEIVAAPGPGAGSGFPAEVRGYTYDGSSIQSLPGYDVTPFATFYGARPGAGDLTGDTREDLIAGAGRDPAADSTVKAYDYNGSSLTLLTGSFVPFPGTFHGVNVSGAALGY
ncbi:MAG: hypothetical protein U0166_19990 [Acidobacteriota bacterium]